MKKEEQMWKAVEEEHGELSQREALVTLTAMEWADANTEWIRPVDEMPPIGMDVLTRVIKGSGETIYQVDKRSEHEWVNLCHYDKVTHWKRISFKEEK